MAFKELGGGSGNVLKWQTVGQVVEGRLVGTKRGKVFNGKPTTLAIIKQANGVDLTVPLTTVLESRFIENEIKPGTVVRITYLGVVAGKQGGPGYKDFRLEVDDSSAPAAPAVAPVAAPAQAPVAAAEPGSYDELAKKLVDKVGAGGAAMLDALVQMYPDPVVRIEQLKTALRAQGVAL